ncbi:MAG: TolC family outer membrane protein [Halioglobus sp.]
MKGKIGVLLPIAALVAASLAPGATAQEVDNLRGAVTQSVLSSPRVNASWYNFEATREAQRSAKGGYFPSVDVVGDIGEEDRDTPLIETGNYSRDAVRFSITQMLFDGFQTREEVSRLGYAKLSRYYDLKRASEEVAFEATEAYVDTMRFQRLVGMAEDNYIVHRQIFDKISERTGGGVSQGVDLEQASARIALAETNLLTEMNNLFDVQTRFQRIVGSLPAEALDMPEVPVAMIPELREVALQQAYQQSPEIDSAIENLRSSQAALNAKNAPMMPRVDLRYRNERENNTDGFDGRFDEEAIELVVSYNLFRGGADSARKREFYNLYNAAIEERKQACINVRQNVMIAFNEVETLEQQLIYLDRNQLAQDKTRRAYLDQFDLGQRTLLDLLDSQNEYFDTQRAYVSAQAALLAAQAKTLSNSGLLLAAMNVGGLNDETIAEMKLNLDRGDDENGEGLCPTEVPREVVVDKEALFAGLMAGSTRYRDAGDNMVALEMEVSFAFNSSVITGNFDTEIANAAQYLKDNPSSMAVVEGHTDSTGAADYNMWLSERRAEAVLEMLINQHGINPGQLSAVGYGMTRPIGDNDTDQGRGQNRRVDLVLDASAATE